MVYTKSPTNPSCTFETYFSAFSQVHEERPVRFATYGPFLFSIDYLRNSISISSNDLPRVSGTR